LTLKVTGGLIVLRHISNSAIAGQKLLCNGDREPIKKNAETSVGMLLDWFRWFLKVWWYDDNDGVKKRRSTLNTSDAGDFASSIL